MEELFQREFTLELNMSESQEADLPSLRELRQMMLKRFKLRKMELKFLPKDFQSHLFLNTLLTHQKEVLNTLILKNLENFIEEFTIS